MKQLTILVPQAKINMSSIAGTVEILNGANAYWKRMGHRSAINVSVAGLLPSLTLDNGFFSIHPANLAELPATDLVIIPSVSYTDSLVKDNAELIQWIRQQYSNGAELATMCSGAFLLAATGLLDGKSCSTHWKLADQFRRLFPNVQLEIDKLIIAESGIYTNGGAYSFLHLVLFLVEKYFDRETAIYCSKVFQIDMDRTAQSAFFIFQVQKNHGDELICEAQKYIEAHVGGKVSFEALALRLATSRRNFDRRFIRATGNTPVEYLQRVKIEMAKKLLEGGRKTIAEVMQEVGYADDKAFREVFRKITGISPLEYRSKFSRGEPSLN